MNRTTSVSRGVALALLIGLSHGSAEAQDLRESDNAQEGPEASKVLATVNGEAVQANDLEQGLVAMHTGQSEQRRSDFDLPRLLDGVIGDVLLAQEATALGMAEESPIPAQIAKKRQSLAAERLEWEEITSKSRPTDEEMEQAFQELFRTATFRVVTLYNKEAASELRAEVDETTDFVALAEEKSVDTYKGRGGLVENLDYFDMPLSVGEVVFSSEPGAILGPLPTNVGWAIVKVVSTEPADPSRRELVAPKVQAHVTLKKAEALKADLGHRVRELHEVSIDDEALAAIRCEPQKDGRLTPGVDDPDAVVAQIGDQTIRARELASVLLLRWKNMRNIEAAQAAIPMVLESMISSQVMTAEASRRGYGVSPEVQQELTAFQRRLLARKYLQEVVRPGTTVSEEEVREYYDQNLESFRRPPRVQVGQITVASEEEAERLVELLNQGTELAWLARQHSIDRFKSAGGNRGWMVPSNTMDPIEVGLANAEVGEAVGPFGYPGNFLVLQVGARQDQGHYSLEEAKGQIRSTLFSQTYAQAKYETIAELKSRSEITIFEDALAALQVTGSREEEGTSESTHGH